MVSDDARNQIAHIFHQRELGGLLVEASSEWMWCLMPGEWPDLPPQEASELGNVVELVQTISLLFQLVSKNESCRRLEECWRLETHCAKRSPTTCRLETGMERKDGLTEPKDWNPRGWTLLKDAIHSKYESSSVPHRRCVLA